jgi:hypothetical protein
MYRDAANRDSTDRPRLNEYVNVNDMSSAQHVAIYCLCAVLVGVCIALVCVLCRRRQSCVPRGRLLLLKDAARPPGWVGGFRPADISTLPLTGNLDNIDKLTRYIPARWPDFGWRSDPSVADSYEFTTFHSDLSRLGYDDQGRIWALICPQWATCFHSVGFCVNCEITVTGVRGWFDESTGECDMDVTSQLAFWFASETGPPTGFIQRLFRLAVQAGFAVPDSKANALIMPLKGQCGKDTTTFVQGADMSIPWPPSMLREADAAYVIYGAVNTGADPTHKDPAVDAFRYFLRSIIHATTSNMFLPNNTLTWNLWTTGPQLVDTQEWSAHAERWRHSLDTIGDVLNTVTPHITSDGNLATRVVTPAQIVNMLTHLYKWLRLTSLTAWFEALRELLVEAMAANAPNPSKLRAAAANWWRARVPHIPAI